MSTGIRSGLRAAGLVALVLAPPPSAAQQASTRFRVGMGGPVLDAAVAVPVLPAPAPTVAVPPQDWVDHKRWGFAIPGMLGGNIVCMVYNELVQPWKEISRTSPFTWRHGPNSKNNLLPWEWEWDDNHFFNNQLFHPIQGTFYFNAARSNGFNYYWSLAFAGIGSYLWECCGERRLGARNDWWNTTLGGAALGEMLYRGTSLILDNEATGLDRYGLEALVLPLNAERFLSRGLYGQWKYAPNPLSRRGPETWGVSFGSGLRKTQGSPHAFFDAEFRYGSPFGASVHRPFDYFTVNVQVNGRDETIGLVRVEAHLRDWGREGGPLKVFVSQNYDYMDSAPDSLVALGYRYGGQSLGLGSALGLSIDTAWVTAQLEVDGVPIGAVNSLHSDYTSPNNPERVREYDFARGVGLRSNLTGLWPAVARVTASYQKTGLWTVSGSNADGYASRHWVDAAEIGAKLELDGVLEFITQYGPVKWAEHWWIGGDWLWFKKRSVYTNPDFLPELHHTSQWRFMISWERIVNHGARVYH